MPIRVFDQDPIVVPVGRRSVDNAGDRGGTQVEGAGRSIEINQSMGDALSRSEIDRDVLGERKIKPGGDDRVLVTSSRREIAERGWRRRDSVWRQAIRRRLPRRGSQLGRGGRGMPTGAASLRRASAMPRLLPRTETSPTRRVEGRRNSAGPLDVELRRRAARTTRHCRTTS